MPWRAPSWSVAPSVFRSLPAHSRRHRKQNWGTSTGRRAGGRAHGRTWCSRWWRCPWLLALDLAPVADPDHAAPARAPGVVVPEPPDAAGTAARARRRVPTLRAFFSSPPPAPFKKQRRPRRLVAARRAVPGHPATVAIMQADGARVPGVEGRLAAARRRRGRVGRVVARRTRAWRLLKFSILIGGELRRSLFGAAEAPLTTGGAFAEVLARRRGNRGVRLAPRRKSARDLAPKMGDLKER